MILKNRVIVITGAGSGLGATLAKKAAKEGAKVVLVSKSKNKLQKVENQLKGGAVRSYVCDIRELSQIKSTVKKIFADFKTIDILVNNAGIWTDDEIEKENPERRQEAFDTNALGNIQFTDEILPYFKEKNSGYIFNVISTSGVGDIPAGDNRLWQTYGATKWAMAGFTKTLREIVHGTKIKVTGFFPGGFESNLYKSAKKPQYHNQPWMMKTDDIADIILFALTRPSDVLMERIVVTKAH